MLFRSEKTVLKLSCSIIEFFNSLSSYESYLWKSLKLSLEQINWYRHKTKDLDNPAKLYPSTITEALTHKLHENKKKLGKTKYPTPTKPIKPKSPRKPKRSPKYEWIYHFKDFVLDYFQTQNINTIPLAPPG